MSEDEAPIRRARGRAPDRREGDHRAQAEAGRGRCAGGRAAGGRRRGRRSSAEGRRVGAAQPRLLPQEARAGLESVDWKSTPSTQDALATALKALGRK